MFRNAKKVMNANKNKKIKEQTKARESANNMKVEKDDDASVDLDEIKQVI